MFFACVRSPGASAHAERSNNLIQMVAQIHRKRVLKVTRARFRSVHSARAECDLLTTHEGVTYLFINEDNRKAFERNPSKYAPAYGGYCAFGASVAKKFVGDPEVWRVVNGRLYLNLDTKIQEQWLKDIRGNIKKADANWVKIEDADPASL